VTIPSSFNILLATTSWITIIHIQNSVCCWWQAGYIHPCDQMTKDIIIKFYFMIQLNTRIICECNVITSNLSIWLKIRISNVNKHWEFSESSRDFSMINSYLLPILPPEIPPDCWFYLSGKCICPVRPMCAISNIYIPNVGGWVGKSTYSHYVSSIGFIRLTIVTNIRRGWNWIVH